MRLFLSALGNSDSINPDMVLHGVKLNAGVDTEASTLFWFNPYLASDFPEITCDKKYFFLWSTDHDPVTYRGGIWWGKGDNLDLSDFEELGLIIDEYQTETPTIIREVHPDGENIHLYFHTQGNDPSNIPDTQETKLITTTGGVLHTATWTDRGHPLPRTLSDDPEYDHSGYCKIYPKDGKYYAIHLRRGGLHISGIYGNQQTYRTAVSTDGGRSFLYEAELNPKNGLTEDIIYEWGWMPTYGRCFEYEGERFFLGSILNYSGVGTPGTGLNQKFASGTYEGNFQVTGPETIISDFYARDFEVYVSGVTAHLYYQSDESATNVSYATYDIRNLLND